MESKTKSLQQVRNKVASAHKDCSPAEKLQFYNQWATQYEEDVFVLNYKAPHLAAAALASVCTVNCDSKLVLDVACGTGLVAEETVVLAASAKPIRPGSERREPLKMGTALDRVRAQLQRFGFTLFHGLDGSAGMLEVAKKKQLYQELKLCMLGQDSLPFDSDTYDAVIIVGALSDGQVPVSVVLELLRVTKPGGLVCLTTRSNVSNLMYKANLEEVMSDMESKGHWEQISVQEVEQWEKAVSGKEVSSKSDYIPGVIYIYRKKLRPLI